MNPLNQADPAQGGEDYLLTLYEVCEILGKSTRTITRYVHRHILHPRGVKSRQGTLEYRFSRAEIDAFKTRQDSIRPYVYLNNKPQAAPSPVASFADYGYLKAPAQKPFLIPGISFPLQQSSVSESPDITSMEKKEFHGAPLSVVADAKKEKKSIEKETVGTEMIQNKEADELRLQKNNDGEIILLLKETTGMLRDQLKVKDDQIKNLDDKVGQLIERNRETNILLKGLQDKIMLLEKPSKKNNDEADASDKRANDNQGGQAVREFNDQAVSSETLKSDKNATTPIRIRVFPETPNAIDSDKEAKSVFVEPVAPNSAAPRPSLSKNSVPARKGLFDRLFK